MGAFEGEGAALLTFDAVTTFALRHWDSHARRCVESFDKHWSGIDLKVYTDEQLELESSWLLEFKRRHAHRQTDNYRMDAVRFAHKVAAIELAYLSGKSEVLIWIDADCVTHASVGAEWLTGLLADGDFGYLKREGKYPECGFMLFRRCPEIAQMIGTLAHLYRSDELFKLAEWHDSFAIDHVRARLEVNSVSLSGNAERTGHPLVNGPLGERLDHLKGKRKARGKSLPTDLKVARKEAYWNG